MEHAINENAHDSGAVATPNSEASGSASVDAAAPNDLTPNEDSVSADHDSQKQMTTTTKESSTDSEIAKELDANTLPIEHTLQSVSAQSASDDPTSTGALLEASLDDLPDKTTQDQQSDVDQRLEKLEKIFDALKIVRFSGTDDHVSETASKANDPVEPASDKRILPIPKTNFMTLQEYEKRNSDPKFSLGESHYALDVIVTGSKPKDPGLTSLSAENGDIKSAHTARDTSQIRFIQINSASLQAVFHQLGDSMPETPVNPTLIFSPFKSLCYRSELLQAQLDQLTESIERSSPTTTQEVSKLAEAGESALPDEETQKRATIDDLKCLMSFYRAYIEPSWLYLRGSHVESVRFADLSSLFQPGDEVFEPGSTQRCWKVIKITGGRPTIQHLFEGEDISGDSPNDREQANISAEGPASGSIQVARKKEVPERMTTSREKAVRDVADDWTTFHIDGYYIDYDGTKFGPVHKKISIDFFSGTMSMMDLAVRPLRSVSDAEMRARRISDGKRLVRCCEDRTKLYYYASSTLSESPSGELLQETWRANNNDSNHFSRSNMRNIRSSKIEERVVVDFSMTFQYNPDWAPEFGLDSYAQYDGREVGIGSENAFYQWDTVQEKFFMTPAFKAISRQYLDYYDKRKSDDFEKQDEWLQSLKGRNNRADRSPLDEETLLLPDRVFGFVLRTRTWTCFSIEHLAEIEDDRTQGWDELQIPKQHKITLMSLFDHHRKRAEIPRPGKWDFDFIEGKGNGLIVLLHGVPGVGKTSTAESLASKYKRPLLPITCGNLGVDADGVERALTENFEMAEAWDAIVLLDEADVFLARRRTEDLQRNALVSIFLRTLEYYNGILFLTTNRTGDFDDAFRSRIHTSLFYDDLDEASSKAIWQSNLARLDRQIKNTGERFEVENGGTEIVEYGMRHFQCLRRNKRQAWNGRQIRNAFHTAVALAEYEGKMDEKVPVLKWQHFKSTANASEKFESYLRITHGSSERDLASQEKLRASIDPHTGNFHFSRNQQNLKEELSRFRTELEDITPFSQRDGIAGADPSNLMQSHSGLPTPPSHPQAATPSMPANPPNNWPQAPAPAPFGYPPNVPQQQQAPYYPYGNPGYPQQNMQPSQTAPPHMPYGQPPMGYPMAGYGQGQYPQQPAYGQPPMPVPPSAPAESAGAAPA